MHTSSGAAKINFFSGIASSADISSGMDPAFVLTMIVLSFLSHTLGKRFSKLEQEEQEQEQEEQEEQEQEQEQ